ncbi:MAG: 4Fe-4S binding protein [Lentimicrobiaceae bacterium]|nr:4Fe-4S binding protein [Lentimicrobiaceae bacterium]
MEQKKETFYHTLELRTEACMGCSHCMITCPTEAIRVVNGKATLIPERCIDCGECSRVCPHAAVGVRQDDFQKIYDFKYRVALMPAVFSAQFPDKITYQQIYKGLISIGFTHVYETENAVDFLIKPYNDYIKERSDKPIISSFCPAIVRLIQVRFPNLVNNLMLIKPPMEITAMCIKKKFEEQGIPFSEVGIFYVTPCAAKVAGIKSSVVEDSTLISGGAINMNYLYNKVYREIKQKGITNEDIEISDFRAMSKDSLYWSLTAGEVRIVDVERKLAIDEIKNVIEFLEKVENDDIEDIDFLELRACYQSCAGGVLCAGNKFLTTERARKRATKANSEMDDKTEFAQYESHIYDNYLLHGKIHPRSIVKLDDNMAEAMKKMKRINELKEMLPGVDCGTCGAPSCQAFAEDIVQKGASIKSCAFVQKMLLQNNKIGMHEAEHLLEKTWGKNRLDSQKIEKLLNELKD